MSAAVGLRVLSPLDLLLGTGDGTALQNVDTTELPNGALCWVNDQLAVYALHKDSTDPPSGVLVVVPASGPGRWMPLVAATTAETIVANITALKALAAPLSGAQAYVLSVRSSWVFRVGSALAADGITIVADNGATGQWLRSEVPDRSWAYQAAWFINASTGNDENLGSTSIAALKTAGELVRRINGQTLKQSTTVNQMTDLAEYVDLSIVLSDTGSKFFWLGDPSAWTSLHAGTLSSAVSLNAAANTPNSVTDAGIGDWNTAGPAGSSLIGHRIRLTSGAAGINGATAGLIKRNTATQARTGPFVHFDPAAPTGLATDIHVNPAGTETYVVERLPGVFGIKISATRFTQDLSTAEVTIDSVEIGKGVTTDSSILMSVEQAGASSIVSRCRLVVSRLVTDLMRLNYVIGCLAPQAISFSGQNIVNSCAIIGLCSQLNGSICRFYGFTTIQGSFVSVRQPTAVVNGLGIFDSSSATFGAVHVDFDIGGRLVIDPTSTIYGSGNAGPGIDVAGGSIIVHAGTIPTVTGSVPGTNDLQIGSNAPTNHSWAAVSIAANQSIYDATRASGIVLE